MNIAGTDYNLNHKALEIYISGCDGYCKGCHNYELWDFNIGNPWYKFNFNKILNPLVDRVWIMGGEPLLQEKKELQNFIYNVNMYTNNKKEIWIWTRFNEIPNNLKQYISYVKTGEYKEDLPNYIEPLFGIKLASNNQKIIKVKND
jgi:anaerobic ribonucleoside-triphosphate reductase activating protein